MSGGGLLPVGGFATTAALKSGLAIQGSQCINIPSLALTTTKNWAIGSSATATVGMPMPAAAHMTRVTCSGHCSAQVGTPVVIVTLWNTNQTAGSEIITATSAATATGVGLVGWTSTTIVNSGKDAVAAGGVILLSVESAATSATILSLTMQFYWTWD